MEITFNTSNMETKTKAKQESNTNNFSSKVAVAQLLSTNNYLFDSKYKIQMNQIDACNLVRLYNIII